jgi:hypothetical protein
MGANESLRRVARAALAAALALATARASADTQLVEVSASVVGTGRTPEQARREAVQRAREEALARTVGVRVAAQQLRLRAEAADGTRRDDFSSLVETSTLGRIVEESVTYRTRLENDEPVFEATIVAVVALDDAATDPGFTIELSTEHPSRTLRDGEPLVLEVTASRSCYLTLIHIGSDGLPGLVVPNRFVPELALEGGRMVRIPGSAARFLIRARVGDGGEHERERILAVATLDPVTFTLDADAGGELSMDAAAEKSFTALNRWLLPIPRARRAEALWEYEIGR